MRIGQVQSFDWTGEICLDQVKESRLDRNLIRRPALLNGPAEKKEREGKK